MQSWVVAGELGALCAPDRCAASCPLTLDVRALEAQSDRGYTSPAMKAAISIPDEVFEAAEQAAKSLGVSRSELYTTAMRDYLERYRREGFTQKLNQVYESDEAVYGPDERLQALQISSLEKKSW